MFSFKPRAALTVCAIGLGVAGPAVVSRLQAAPVISRLTPPSALFTYNDPGAPYTARFLPEQRFDLQVTVKPDAEQTITEAAFFVDGRKVQKSVSVTPATVAITTPTPRNPRGLGSPLASASGRCSSSARSAWRSS